MSSKSVAPDVRPPQLSPHNPRKNTKSAMVITQNHTHSITKDTDCDHGSRDFPLKLNQENKDVKMRVETAVKKNMKKVDPKVD